jgi:hypothetical protein
MRIPKLRLHKPTRPVLLLLLPVLVNIVHPTLTGYRLSLVAALAIVALLWRRKPELKGHL